MPAEPSKKDDLRRMVFSDQSFLYFFLPLALLLGILARRSRYFTTVIFLSSVLFYFWSAGYQVWLLLASIVINHSGGLVIGRTRAKPWLGAFIAANLALLAFFKYGFFITTNLGLSPDGTVGHWLGAIALPIGISFFTFQGISYLVDVYRDETPAEPSFMVFAAYLAFFPQLIAGPVVRFSDVTRDIHAPRTDIETFASGARRFSHGLVKKLVIADTVAIVAEAAFKLNGDDVTFATAALGAIAYTLQIYFDFSGYSDMAIGLGLMFGIRFNENFLHPYSSTSITEFWRRWHISLSTWFRDYLYIPLGGNRDGAAKTYRNLLFVFAATGLWHGAAWTFVIWGLYHGAFLIGERLVWGRDANQRRNPILRAVYCLPVVIVGWIIFRAESMGQAWSFIRALTQPFAVNAMVLHPDLLAAASPLPLIVGAFALIIFLAPPDKTVGRWVAATPETHAAGLAQLAYLAAGLAAATMLSLSINYSPFLYFRF